MLRLLSRNTRALAQKTIASPVRYQSSTAKSLHVGVVGAGQIGTAVGLGLLRHGHKVTITDISETNREELEAAGATWVGTATDVVADQNPTESNPANLITALPAPPHVSDVMEKKDGGLLSALPKGSTWIDHTTTDPEEVKRLHEICISKDIGMIEAPLTGGFVLLQAGMMTVLAGGDTELMAKYESVMRCYAATVLHMGPVGKATVVKVITNQLAGAHLILAAEATLMAKRAGVDLDNFFDGVRASAGNSYVFETEVPLMYNQSFDPGFFISLHNKDLGIGRGIANHYGNSGESYDDLYKMFALTEKVYKETEDKYGPTVGSSYPAKLIQDDSGTNLGAKGYDDWKYTIDKVKSGSIGVVHKNIGRDEK